MPITSHRRPHRTSRPRRTLVALAAVVLVLAGTALPSQAAADVRPGTYSGAATDENRPSLRVTSDGRVADFTITVFPSCTDDSGVTATLTAPLRIADDGTFSGTATHEVRTEDGQSVEARSEISGTVRPDGIAEGQYSWELTNYACSAMAYFWLRNEATTDREPPRPTGPVTVHAGTYTDASGASMTVSANRRITGFTAYYPWYCGLSYAGQRLGYVDFPVSIAADGSFSTRIPDGAGGTETLRGQFHHDGSMWGSISYVNAGSLCSGSAGVTMTRPGSGGGNGTFFLNDGWGPEANRVFTYGRAADEVLVGDWDGNGTDTVTLRRGNTFYLSNAQRGGAATTVFRYGRAGDTILVGDWDGDGVDTLAVRRGNEYHVKNSLTSGEADVVVRYGRATDPVVVGDWDGDRKDTFAVRRGSQYHVKNAIAPGEADRVFHYGRARDVTLVGDWDADGRDTLAVRRGKQYHVKNSIAPGEADLVRNYGRVDDEVHVGDWNGDGRDTLGVRRVP